MGIPNKPFSAEYVINLTRKNMRNAIELSIEKTAARIPEFAGDGDKSKEILETLSYLHQMKAGLQ